MYCTECGRQVEVGRFCTNCGAALAGQWRTDTAERQVTAVIDPIDHVVRPLYADDAHPDATAIVPVVPTALSGPVPAAVPARPASSGPWRRPPTAWGVAAAALLVVCLVAWLVGRGLSGDSGTGAGPGAAPVSPDDVIDLTRGASASAPDTAPPRQDLTGDMVRYEASNLLDGVASTAWRMAGDGSGETLTITLPGPSVVTRVGLINGYAKVDHDGSGHETNWYDRNRQVLEVEWAFDDGTTVVQHLGDTRKMQSIDVGPVATSTLKLTIMFVSAPGDRDYTALSDVLVEGAPA